MVANMQGLAGFTWYYDGWSTSPLAIGTDIAEPLSIGTILATKLMPQGEVFFNTLDMYVASITTPGSLTGLYVAVWDGDTRELIAASGNLSNSAVAGSWLSVPLSNTVTNENNPIVGVWSVGSKIGLAACDVITASDTNQYNFAYDAAAAGWSASDNNYEVDGPYTATAPNPLPAMTRLSPYMPFYGLKRVR